MSTHETILGPKRAMPKSAEHVVWAPNAPKKTKSGNTSSYLRVDLILSHKREVDLLLWRI